MATFGMTSRCIIVIYFLGFFSMDYSCDWLVIRGQTARAQKCVVVSLAPIDVFASSFEMPQGPVPSRCRVVWGTLAIGNRTLCESVIR